MSQETNAKAQTATVTQPVELQAAEEVSIAIHTLAMALSTLAGEPFVHFCPLMLLLGEVQKIMDLAMIEAYVPWLLQLLLDYFRPVFPDDVHRSPASSNSRFAKHSEQ